MWKRRTLKKSARKAFLGNYWHSIAVCLVLAFLVGAYPSNNAPTPVDEVLQQTRFVSTSNSEILDMLLGNMNPEREMINYLERHQAQRGILAGVFNNITRSGSFVFGVLNAVNQFVFGDRIVSGVLILVGAALLFLFWLLVGNPLRIGACRFFLESRQDKATSASRLFYLFRLRKLARPAKAMLLKTVYTSLWSLTIVGGVIKGYSYRMVPYILAENPDIRSKDAFAISRRMMKKNKWRAFLLDCSFIGWNILAYLSLGVVAYVFSNPYKAAADAELYITLRRAVAPEDARLLAPGAEEAALPAGGKEEAFPVHLIPVPPFKSGAWNTGSYLARYTPANLVLIFFAFCMVGWVWEVLVDLFQHGYFVNRGTLYGPWLPIYGAGGTGVVLLFHRLGKRPLLTFGCVFVFCGLLEYFTSWALERLHGERWWDYSGYFLNLNGRVCLEGLLVFGLGGCAAIYFIAPALNDLFEKIPKKAKRGVCSVLVCLFMADLAVSAAYPNTVAVTSAQTAPAASSAVAQAAPTAARAGLGEAEGQWEGAPAAFLQPPLSLFICPVDFA